MIKFSEYNFKNHKNYINLRNENLIFLGNKNFIKLNLNLIIKSILCIKKNFFIKCKCKSCKWKIKNHPDLFKLNFKNFLNLKISNENLIRFEQFYLNKNIILSNKKLLIIIFPEYFHNIYYKIIINIIKDFINENLKLIIITNKIYLIPFYLKIKLIKIFFTKKFKILSLFKKNFYINYIKNNIKYLKYIFKYYKNYNILNKKFFTKNYYKIYIYFIKLIKLSIKNLSIKIFFNKFKLLINLIKKFLYDKLKLSLNNKTSYFNYKFCYKKKININNINKFYIFIIDYFDINNKNYKNILFEKLLFNFNILIGNE